MFPLLKKRRPHVPTFVLACVALVPALGSAQERSLEACVAAKSASELEVAFGRLMDGADRTQLELLKSQPQTTIALRASWQEVLNEFARNQQLADKEFGDSSHAHRFLGFLEGRAFASLPSWWCDSLLTGRYESNGVLTFRVPGLRELYRETNGPFSLRPGVDLNISGEEAILKSNNRTMHFPVKVLDELNTCEGKYFDALLQDDACFLAIHTDAGDSFSLGRFNRATSALSWKSKVWAADRTMLFGVSWPCVTLAYTRDQVIVFGYDARALFAEGFSAASGESRFRFCTGYLSKQRE